MLSVGAGSGVVSVIGGVATGTGVGASVIGAGGGFGAIFLLGLAFFAVRFAFFFAPFFAARFLAKQLHRLNVEVPLVINFRWNQWP
jgi:hypothetical protein